MNRESQVQYQQGVTVPQPCLLVRDVLQPLPHHFCPNRLEPELGAPRRDWLDDAANVVAQDEEPRDLEVRPAQRLRITSGLGQKKVHVNVCGYTMRRRRR